MPYTRRCKMYDRHKSIIKWYEYDARKLYAREETDNAAGNAEHDTYAAPPPDEPMPAEAAGQDSATGDPALDDEVARIMAAFSDAKQNGVDDVFAKMAAQEDGNNEGTPADEGAPAMSEQEEQDALLASLLKPKQNTVDDLVAKARES